MSASEDDHMADNLKRLFPQWFKENLKLRVTHCNLAESEINLWF